MIENGISVLLFTLNQLILVAPNRFRKIIEKLYLKNMTTIQDFLSKVKFSIISVKKGFDVKHTIKRRRL